MVRPDADGGVTILERYPDTETGAKPTIEEKARLNAYRWERIADATAQEFNHRLQTEGLRSGRWLKRETPLAPYFGKELTLLAWAIEDAEATILPMMIANWRGLAPEERWWFYTTINATASGPDHGRDRGWRKAIKIAFADNPVELPPSALLIAPEPEAGRTTRHKKAEPTESAQGMLRLFDEPT